MMYEGGRRKKLPADEWEKPLRWGPDLVSVVTVAVDLDVDPVNQFHSVLARGGSNTNSTDRRPSPLACCSGEINVYLNVGAIRTRKLSRKLHTQR